MCACVRTFMQASVRVAHANETVWRCYMVYMVGSGVVPRTRSRAGRGLPEAFLDWVSEDVVLDFRPNNRTRAQDGLRVGRVHKVFTVAYGGRMCGFLCTYKQVGKRVCVCVDRHP